MHTLFQNLRRALRRRFLDSAAAPMATSLPPGQDERVVDCERALFAVELQRCGAIPTLEDETQARRDLIAWLEPHLDRMDEMDLAVLRPILDQKGSHLEALERALAGLDTVHIADAIENDGQKTLLALDLSLALYGAASPAERVEVAHGHA